MKDIKIKPLGDRVVVLPDSGQDKNKAKFNIIIPDTAGKDRPERGLVVAVGEGRVTDSGAVVPLSVKKGQIVLFSEYGYTKIKLDDTEYLIMNESNILAIID
jgi:chaperonin GroES